MVVREVDDMAMWAEALVQMRLCLPPGHRKQPSALNPKPLNPKA